MSKEQDIPTRTPDIEFKRKIRLPSPITHGIKLQGYRSYGHIYWKPLIVHLFGRTLIGRKHMRRDDE